MVLRYSAFYDISKVFLKFWKFASQVIHDRNLSLHKNSLEIVYVKLGRNT